MVAIPSSAEVELARGTRFVIFVSSSLRVYAGISLIKVPPGGHHFLGIF